MTILSVFVGGGLGAMARFLLSRYLSQHSFTAIPLGTLIENLGGSLLIGFFFELFEGGVVPAYLRALVLIGFIGGFTTFSTYALETLRLLQQRSFFAALINLAVQNFAGLVAVSVGIYLSDLLRLGVGGGRHA